MKYRDTRGVRIPVQEREKEVTNGSYRSQSSANGSNRRLLPRWHRLLYWLVAFALFTILLGLYLSYRYVAIHMQSMAVNQTWVERLDECSQLGQLIAAVNAPGNDVFESHDIAGEEAKMQAALRFFSQRLDALLLNLHNDDPSVETPAVLDNLQVCASETERMAEKARTLFELLRRGRTREAGESMAAMDRHFAAAAQALESARTEIAIMQKRHFEEQTAVASSLQRFHYVTSCLILLVIGASLVYGQRLRRQLESATREKEAHIEALRRSEAELDRRVGERTAELLRSNESLSREIDERRQVEEALRRSDRRAQSLVEVRQQLLKKVMSAQEDERRRIARDLHDEIGQAITSLLIGLRTVADTTTLAAAQERAKDLRRIAVSALEEVRRLARGLRPSVLDDLGLSAALEHYAADYAQAHNIKVDVQAEAVAERLPEAVETALYRIAQEALTNTAKHAAAKHVRIVLEQKPRFVQLTVSDDGRGFASGMADPRAQLGLSGMRERAALFNGTVLVESNAGRGTTVTVQVPHIEVDHGARSCSCGG